MKEPYYLLGHSAHELDRLDLQGELYRPVTLRALEDAGVGPGSRVLDIGCGTGDVSIVASGLVGREGVVLGVDRSQDAVHAARQRADLAGATAARFEVASIDAFGAAGSQPGPFDVVVGRFVLMHQERPESILAAAARWLRPGGRLVMIESWMNLLLDGRHSFPFSPTYDRIVRWKCAVVGGAGADVNSGGRLRQIFAAADLPDPDTQLNAAFVGGADSAYYRYVAKSLLSMLPAAATLGFGEYSAEDADDIEGALRAEVLAANGALVAWPVMVARCTVPGVDT